MPKLQTQNTKIRSNNNIKPPNFTINSNPIKQHKYKCNCKIMGKPPIIHTIIPCLRHKTLHEELHKRAPNTTNKILEWYKKTPPKIIQITRFDQLHNKTGRPKKVKKPRQKTEQQK